MQDELIERLRARADYHARTGTPNAGNLELEAATQGTADNVRIAELEARLAEPVNLCEMPEVAAMRYIEQLRSNYGSVTILPDNEEADYREQQVAIDCCGEWTNWQDQRFCGESVLQCLAKAVLVQERALALLERTEAEAGEDAGVLLRELWLQVHHAGYPPEGSWDGCLECSEFDAFLTINTPEAHLAAATMLVPDGCQMELWTWPSGSAEANLHFNEGRTVQRTGKTPAHALIAAIARSLDHDR